MKQRRGDKLKTILRLGISLVLMLSSLLVINPQSVSAAQLTARKLTLSTSNPAASAATTTYTFNFTTGTTATFQSFQAQICTTASSTCTTPTGFLNSTSTFTSSTLTGSWTVNTSTAGSIRATATGASSTTTGTAKQIVFGNVQNPTTTNQTFFARITLYSDTGYATPVDTGTVAASTATQINLTGVVNEALVFCTGTSVTAQNCGTVAGSTVDFGTFSASATSSGTSVMVASTNGLSGYSITINGSTLTCTTCSGSPTIAALASQTASSTGTAQFGTNLVSNSTPSVGAAVSGPGSGTATANYGTTNQFRFVTADSVASAAAATDADTYTVSYIVNVPAAQAAGTYTATMTYIATATF
jgi:hypothetical protein